MASQPGTTQTTTQPTNQLNVSTNTHTLYTDYARKLRKANEDIAQTGKYLDPASPHYLPTYIANLEALQASATPPEGIGQKLATMRSNLVSYQARAAAARQVLAEYPAKLKALEQANAVFSAPPEKQDEYLYVLDEESCEASCINWEAVAANPGQELVAAVQQVRFQGKQDIALTGEKQTDAVRVWNHHVLVDGLCISDQRCYTDAHRDAIQLIPPALGKHEGGKYIRLADQMAGTVMENVTVQGCQVVAPHGPLQGIFASDGMQRNLKLLGNDISTCGSHSISVAGLLEGGEISGNILREVAGGEMPRISLYPARIGGNMADDGVVCILSFAAEADKPAMAYGSVAVQQPNRLLRANGTETIAPVDDMRTLLPDNFLKLGVGLTDFHYHAYLDDYSRLTLGEYRLHDPWGAQQMQAWLTLRVQEFTQGREANHPLGQPGSEQQTIGERFLKPALQAMQDGSVEQIRLVDLEHTAIRSFAMKRLAILHGTVAPLVHIALQNRRRALTLPFLLEPQQLANVVKIAFVEANVHCAGSMQPVAGWAFSLFFDKDNIYSGHTDANGRVAMDGLPLAPYILQPADVHFSFALADAPPAANTAANSAAEAAVVLLAQSLLNDFRHKVPVVGAYLQHAPAQEPRCLRALQRHLAAVGARTEADITPKVRQDCLLAMGMGHSKREPYRQTVSILLDCPRTDQAKNGCGCLMLLGGLLGKANRKG